MTDPELSGRFWAWVDRGTAADDCWMWAGPRNSRGYAVIGIGKRKFMAARLAFEAIEKPLADGEKVTSLCRERLCVRPDHHRALDHYGMSIRSVAGDRMALSHCKNGHPFDEANTRIRPASGSGRRVCRACNRAAVARYKAKKREAVAMTAAEET